MTAELRPSPDFFTYLRRILADAQRTAYTAILAQSYSLATVRYTMPPKLPSGELIVITLQN